MRIRVGLYGVRGRFLRRQDRARAGAVNVEAAHQAEGLDRPAARLFAALLSAPYYALGDRLRLAETGATE